MSLPIDAAHVEVTANQWDGAWLSYTNFHISYLSAVAQVNEDLANSVCALRVIQGKWYGRLAAPLQNQCVRGTFCLHEVSCLMLPKYTETTICCC